MKRQTWSFVRLQYKWLCQDIIIQRQIYTHFCFHIRRHLKGLKKRSVPNPNRTCSGTRLDLLFDRVEFRKLAKKRGQKAYLFDLDPYRINFFFLKDSNVPQLQLVFFTKIVKRSTRIQSSPNLSLSTSFYNCNKSALIGFQGDAIS